MTKNQKISSELYMEQSKASPVAENSSKLHWEIMRSVDPAGYRNIELEVWEEMRKGKDYEAKRKKHKVLTNNIMIFCEYIMVKYDAELNVFTGK